MTHDPLCLALEDEGFSVAYFGTAGGSDHIACLSCYLIGKVEDRSLAAQIDHYNNGRDMGLAEAREAIIAVPWRTDAAGAVILRVDAMKAIDGLRGGVTAHVEFGAGNAQGGAGHGLGGGPVRPTLGGKS